MRNTDLRLSGHIVSYWSREVLSLILEYKLFGEVAVLINFSPLGSQTPSFPLTDGNTHYFTIRIIGFNSMTK